MLKLARLAVAAVLVLCLIAPVGVALGDSNTNATTMVGTVNAPGSFAWLRSGPGTSYAQVGKLAHGAAVTIEAAVNGQAVHAGQPTWYRIGGGRYIYGPFVRVASKLPDNPAPPPVVQPGAEKWIEVDLSERKLYAWEGGLRVLTTVVAIGKPSTPTVKGTFRVYAKYVAVNMSGPGYYQPRVPHTMFYYGGFAIHGAYWHTQFGTARSHGCVNLNLTDAAWLYGWTPMGTKVVVHD